MSEFFRLVGLVIICIYVFLLLTAKINELIEKAKLYKAMRENKEIKLININLTKEKSE